MYRLFYRNRYIVAILALLVGLVIGYLAYTEYTFVDLSFTVYFGKKLPVPLAWLNDLAYQVSAGALAMGL